jgi:hypothetical protein
MELSDFLFNEWVVGLGVPILIGLGFTLLADEFKEYRAARVCFWASALWACGKVIMWSAFAVNNFWGRAAAVFIVCGLASVGLSEALRLTTRREQPEAMQPYTRTESFILDVPYYGAEDGFPLTYIPEEDYPLRDAYSCLTNVLILYAHVPPGSQIKQIAELDTNEKRTEALTQALRYCIIDELFATERGSSKFGISRKKGSIAEYNPAVPPPDSTDYPPEKFLSLLSTIPFGNRAEIQMLYQVRALRVPKNSSVDLAVLKMDPNDWVNHWVFRIQKPSVFSFAVGVAPINAAVGVLPESFPDRLKRQQAKYVTYSFAITMKIQIARTPTNGSEVDDFKRWSDGLWVALRDKFDVRRQK